MKAPVISTCPSSCIPAHLCGPLLPIVLQHLFVQGLHFFPWLGAGLCLKNNVKEKNPKQDKPLSFPARYLAEAQSCLWTKPSS